MKRNERLRYTVVRIVEQFKGAYSGHPYTRAISAEGHKIVGPSHLFTLVGDGTAKVNPDEIIPDDSRIPKSVEDLKKAWMTK